MRNYLRKMDKIGEYVYPTLGKFGDAVAISEKAIENFGGIIPMPDAAKVLGYTIHENTKLSGTVYKRLNDLESFGLFKRDRGGLRITDLAKDALNPNEEETAQSGTIKAIRNITIIGKAFDEWNGVLPDITALPGKLSEIVGIPWTDCRKHSGSLYKLFDETFHLLGSKDEFPTNGTLNVSSASNFFTEQRIGEQKSPILKGELKTTIGSVFITDNSTLKLARNLLDVFEEKLNKATKSKQDDGSNSAEGSKGV